MRTPVKSVAHWKLFSVWKRNERLILYIRGEQTTYTVYKILREAVDERIYDDSYHCMDVFINY